MKKTVRAETDMNRIRQFLCRIGNISRSEFVWNALSFIMRRQNTLLAGYAAAAAAAFFLSRHMITHYGITGAAWLYTGIMTGLTVILFLFMLRGIRLAPDGTGTK